MKLYITQRLMFDSFDLSAIEMHVDISKFTTNHLIFMTNTFFQPSRKLTNRSASFHYQ
jgi:hypothetical protein